jgi:hypothetical protein
MSEELIELFDQLEEAIRNDMESDRALDIMNQIKAKLY